MTGPTALIAEDEPALGEWLADELRHHWPELVIVGIADNGRQAAEMIEALDPDVAFLDIRLPDRTGLEIAAADKARRHIVFVTAYDQYALAAFDSEAIDYLLKPVEEDRLLRTISRLKKHLGESPPDYAPLMKTLIVPEPGYLDWIQASRGDEIEFVPVDSVIALTATDKLTTCHTAEGQYLLRLSLKELEARLDPRKFWRVHRNAIIRVASIRKVKRDVLYGLVVFLHGIEQGIRVSRSYTGLFRAM